MSEPESITEPESQFESEPEIISEPQSEPEPESSQEDLVCVDLILYFERCLLYLDLLELKDTNYSLLNKIIVEFLTIIFSAADNNIDESNNVNFTLYDENHDTYDKQIHINFIWRGDLSRESVYDFIIKDSHVKGGARLKIFRNIQHVKYRPLIQNALVLSANNNGLQPNTRFPPYNYYTNDDMCINQVYNNSVLKFASPEPEPEPESNLEPEPEIGGPEPEPESESCFEIDTELIKDMKVSIDYQNSIRSETLNKIRETWCFRELSKIPIIDNDNYDYYKKNIISSIQIKFNNMIREENLDHNLLEDIQSYNYYLGSKSDGIGIYSFGLNNSYIQPSGHSNLSHINKIDIKFNIKKSLKNQFYDILLYNRIYNVLKLNNGIAELMYFK